MSDTPTARSSVTFGAGFVLGTLCGLGAGVCGLGAIGTSTTEVAPEPVDAALVAPAPAPAVEAPPAPPAEPERTPEPEAEAPPAPPPPPPAPRKAAAPAPAPVAPAPAPAPVAAAPKVTMHRGPTEVVFVGSDGTRHTPDAVPPGKFDVLANWGDGLVSSGRITVKEGKAPTLLCDPATRTCSSK